MNLNQKISVLVDNAQNPINSPNTRAVAVSLIFGGKPTSDGYLDTIEEGIDGKPRRTTIWLLEDKQIEFPAFAGDSMSQAELLKKWGDRAWIEANPTHPLATAKHALEQIDILRDFTNSKTPHIKLVRGGRSVIIETKPDENGKPVPTEEGKKFLKKFLKEFQK